MSILLTTFSSLLPPLLGFAANMLPNIVSYYEKKQKYDYEVKLTELRIKLEEAGLDHKEVMESIRSVVDEGESLRSHDGTISTNEYVNILRATVRPILTYCFFLFFCAIKIATMVLMINAGADPFQIVETVWDSYTISIFGAVIGFWFGTRSMVYLNEKFELSKK